jgi:hypothetical protein
MAYYFENLKNSILKYFGKSNSKKEKEPQFYDSTEKWKANIANTAKPVQENEESSVLLDETERKRGRIRMKFEDEEEDKTSSIFLFQGSKLPMIYGSLAFLTITFMLFVGYLNEMNNKIIENIYSEIGPHKFMFISMFNLPRLNHFVFHILNSSTALTGFGLVYSILMMLKMKFKQHSYDNYQYIKLYISVLYGFIANFMHLAYGTIFYMDGYENINQLIHREIHINLNEFIFYLQIFFSILFGLFTTFLIYSMKTKPSYSIESQEQEEQVEYKWTNYRLLILIYLSFLLVANILIILHNNKFIFTSFDSMILKSNYVYLIAFLPYGLYFFNILLYVMYYGELKSVSLNLSAPAEKINYEQHHRNIL